MCHTVCYTITACKWHHADKPELLLHADDVIPTASPLLAICMCNIALCLCWSWLCRFGRGQQLNPTMSITVFHVFIVCPRCGTGSCVMTHTLVLSRRSSSVPTPVWLCLVTYRLVLLLLAMHPRPITAKALRSRPILFNQSVNPAFVQSVRQSCLSIHAVWWLSLSSLLEWHHAGRLY